VSWQPPENPWLVKNRQEREARRRAWLRENERPERRAAWDAVREALKDGRLTRSPCQVQANGCEGKKAPTQFHHTMGYAEEHHLTGVWVCLSCHQHLHRLEIRRAKKREARERAEQVRSPGVIILED